MNSRKFRNGKTCCITVLFQIFILFSFLGVAIFSVSASESTVVQVDPATLVVSAEETFTLDISCVPGQSIKSFELKVSFDPLLLRANSVSEGAIFEGYTTFFNEGTIDNIEGTIVDIYNLIVGSGSISDPGVFVTISFTSLSYSGTSLINLYDVGVTNDIGYVIVSISDGNVTVLGGNQPPLLSSALPSNGATDVSIDTSALSITIQDPEGDLFDWSITTSPNVGSNSGINASNGGKSCSISGLSYSTLYHWYVSCRDYGGGSWTNASYSFITESEPPGGGSSGGEDPFPPEPEQNTPPDVPSIPIGPIFVERGVTYSYSSSAFDPDDDQIRLQFDWGDGTTSLWSDLVDSNTSVSFQHAWDEISTFNVKVIAQDGSGANSTWSTSLTVIVSESNTSGEPPIINISGPSNASANQSIIFDASDCIDPDGTIVEYFWDFGDGTTATGKTPEHTFIKPGVYTITLLVTDDTGTTYSKTFTVVIEAGSEESSLETQNSFPIYVLAVLLGIVIITILCCWIFIKKYKQGDVTHRRIASLDSKIARLDREIKGQGNHKTRGATIKKEEKEKHTITPTYEETQIEQKVDNILLSKIYEEIDKF